jgi:hypothetical protein
VTLPPIFWQIPEVTLEFIFNSESGRNLYLHFSDSKTTGVATPNFLFNYRLKIGIWHYNYEKLKNYRGEVMAWYCSWATFSSYCMKNRSGYKF